jgi:hypothetical protein
MTFAQETVERGTSAPVAATKRGNREEKGGKKRGQRKLPQAIYADPFSALFSALFRSPRNIASSSVAAGSRHRRAVRLSGHVPYARLHGVIVFNRMFKS